MGKIIKYLLITENSEERIGVVSLRVPKYVNALDVEVSSKLLEKLNVALKDHFDSDEVEISQMKINYGVPMWAECSARVDDFETLIRLDEVWMY